MDTPHTLERPDGSIAHRSHGAGPVVLLVPGMGDVSGVYRDVIPPLVAGGYRVVTADLRGHGESDTTFTAHGLSVVADDIAALVGQLDEPVVVVGSSVSATASAWAALDAPELIRGIVMISPSLDPSRPPAPMRLALKVLLRRPWGPGAWGTAYKGLNKGRHAPWLGEHLAELKASLARPGGLESLRSLANALIASPPALPDRLVVPALALHGALDPEFDDPAEELVRIRERFDGVETVLVDDAGHYAHAQRPDVVVAAIRAFLERLAP